MVKSELSSNLAPLSRSGPMITGKGESHRPQVVDGKPKFLSICIIWKCDLPECLSTQSLAVPHALHVCCPGLLFPGPHYSLHKSFHLYVNLFSSCSQPTLRAHTFDGAFSHINDLKIPNTDEHHVKIMPSFFSCWVFWHCYAALSPL